MKHETTLQKTSKNFLQKIYRSWSFNGGTSHDEDIYKTGILIQYIAITVDIKDQTDKRDKMEEQGNMRCVNVKYIKLGKCCDQP